MSLDPTRKSRDQKWASRGSLTSSTIEHLIDAAGKQRTNEQRNAALIRLMYQFGLRTCKAIALTWNQIDLNSGTINVVRSKENAFSTHPLGNRELELLQALRKEQLHSHYVFPAETEESLTTFQIQRIVMAAGARAGLPFRVNPHMLRFAAAHRNQPVS